MFYMTPQTFINDLRDGTCDAQDIVLVVIGEYRIFVRFQN